MRRLAGLAAVLASALAHGQAPQSPYVLKIDPAPYLLHPAYRAGESASAGSSSAPSPTVPSAQLTPLPPTHSVPPADRTSEMRERHYEYRIRTLEEERDAWRRRAEVLEAERLGLRR
ncbi:MAG TPA: hypothetical protein VG873_07770 [Burkholderiales bacterium]|nr:hypothetical protein [Burkholderiales bacterium]